MFWPLLLIAIGVLFLLNSLGYIDLDFGELWRFWPVLLILIGLDLLLGRRSWLGNLIVLLLTLTVLGGCILLLAKPAGQLAARGRAVPSQNLASERAGLCRRGR